MKARNPGRSSPRPRGPAQIVAPDVDPSTFAVPIVVTDLAEVPGRPGRVGVAVNGVDLGSVTLDFISTNSMRAGREMTRDLLRETVDAVGRTAVLDKALDLLAVRGRSSRDLRIRLRRAGATDPAITWSLERLASQGLVDDAVYARQVARSRVLGGGVSRRKVVTELRRRGIAAEMAEEAIESTLAEVDLDEHGAALEAARKRVRALQSLDPATRRQRLYAFLARRGYESDVVRRVMREVLE